MKKTIPSHIIQAYCVLFSCLLLISITGCSKKIDIGEWHINKDGHEYFFTEAEISDKFEGIVSEWESEMLIKGGAEIGYKNIGDPPQEKNPSAESQSVFVSESGYAFINITNGEETNALEWKWKVTVENRSEHPVRVTLSYALLDKNDVVLTLTRVQDAFAELIKPNSTETINKRDTWYFQSKADPYPVDRIVRGDYGLTLKALPLINESNKTENKSKSNKKGSGFSNKLFPDL